MRSQTVISSQSIETNTHILVIHPDPTLTKSMQQALDSEGYQVTIAQDGMAGLIKIHDCRPDLVILGDTPLNLPGQQICQRLRATRNFTPVIAVAQQESQARIAILDAGADDCISHPFKVEELLARIRARLRRVDRSSSQTIRLGNLVIDPNTRQVYVDHQEIELTAKEFDLLLYLVRHAGQVMTKEQILATVWQYEFTGTSNIVEVYVGYLRRKLTTCRSQQLIQTIRGVGYALRIKKVDQAII
jgi:DNA-binding response OmpR family regulator